MTFSPNCSGILKSPLFIVIHYTASGNFINTRDRLLNKESKVSAHYLIGRAGELAQLVPLNKCAWHAGESSWRGYTGLNKYSIGIELVSFGPLVLRDGKYYSAEYGTEVTEVHDGAPPTSTYRYWQTFTEPQLAQLRATIDDLRRLYPSIVEVVGHRDIAPKRKQDPWPLDCKTL
jgi:N-acetylmuramoyl-L-alanine amidase